VDARNEEAQPTVGIMRHVCASETWGDQTGRFQMLDCAWRGLAVADPGEKGVQREEENGLENSIEQRPGNDQTKQGEIPGMLHPIKVTLGGALGHQGHDSRVSIERRHGQQVERTQEQIQNEKNTQRRGEKCRVRAIRGHHQARIAMDEFGRTKISRR